ncbi:hypothetical protein Goshw_027009 [Gossypium schwendimanii]|uniref:Uncharacterized protein n=1 Tax=Gossypium schwendimanii TaxID=34291 RepID=A0A7J9LR92_GOSSC|nr:hypothetical protein [Gossypium schwendimanii]
MVKNFWSLFHWAKENRGQLKINKNENIKDGSTKKVHLKEQCVDLSVFMAVDLVLDPPLSLKERLVGKSPIGSRRENTITTVEMEDDFDFMEGDITRSIVTSIPSIDFSKRVLLFLLHEMGTIVVIKLLDRNIGYTSFQNRDSNIWRPYGHRERLLLG